MRFVALLVAIVVATVFECSVAINVPSSFLGLWVSTPEYSVFGPFSEPTYVVSIGKSPEGDYLIENNFIYENNDQNMGWQRFYIEGSEDNEGVLWYCGSLHNYSAFVENTGTKAFKVNTSDATSLSMCLDSDSVTVMGEDDVNPFKYQCSHCDCASWTMTYNETTQQLSSTISMAGSNHLKAVLTRVGDALPIEAGYMPAHGADFSCDFSENGRDAVPIDFGEAAPHPIKLSASSRGCPHLRTVAKTDAKRKLLSDAVANLKKPNSAVDALPPVSQTKSAKRLEYCYSLNRYSGYNVAWSLDVVKQLLHVSVSAPAANNQTWVAIGFRPLSRTYDNAMNDYNTGNHNNFGMAGADIVVGSIAGGIRQVYAAVYTGEPTPDESLTITDSSVTYSEEDQRVTLSFTRPLVSVFVVDKNNISAKFNSFSRDVVWAWGPYFATKKSGCKYHSNKRGMRVINWAYPEYSFFDEWKC
jgi:hypothetical protein